ncbi:Chitin recognition protein [Pyrenophora tritici-repentis]|uniref:Chitin recognition protein n=3 Tax=Pyrenophora tritici-repentis TaxID=45151 RepID=A0A922N3F4_9PLEO|nr:uncharacterized protein PTRG_08200 [Pyrenophora tritici-repentis Pt-1C-BFP]EDU51119.1 conserved hypothetical protein [Pyrenophora tritici-repentis Pt-1C-BFP]KAI1508400.1 Chitin recognition protein [Pyrenophora tritici-repentis]KAI1665892.1 Chitin recognition protein [Pyrenophora tritici-repentis]KAI1678865.1 Chitin recognition protein [Pyrenophora tritici-repentis]
MPSTYSLLSLSLLLAPTALAANTIKFVNHCPYPLYYWLVGPANYSEQHLSGDGYGNLVPSHGGSVIHEMLDTSQLGGGMTLKIRDLEYYNVQPAGIMQVEYNLELQKGALWYDLSAIDCVHGAGAEVGGYCPFMAGGISLNVANVPAGTCNSARCSNSKCEGTYMTHESFLDEPSFWCGAGADLMVETCIEGPGIQTFYGKGPNGPFPEPMSAPELTNTPEPVSSPAPSTTSTMSPHATSEQTSGPASYLTSSTTSTNAPHATPEHTHVPAPFPSSNLTISTLGECGHRSNETCAGSAHGICCSNYGYCGSTWAHCSGNCQQTHGFCLRGGENGTQMARVSPKAGFGDLPKPSYTAAPGMMRMRRPRV